MPETKIIVEALPDGEVAINGEHVDPSGVEETIARQIGVDEGELDSLIEHSKDHYDLAMVLAGLASGVAVYDGRDLWLSREGEEGTASKQASAATDSEAAGTSLVVNALLREMEDFAAAIEDDPDSLVKGKLEIESLGRAAAVRIRLWARRLTKLHGAKKASNNSSSTKWLEQEVAVTEELYEELQNELPADTVTQIGVLFQDARKLISEKSIEEDEKADRVLDIIEQVSRLMHHNLAPDEKQASAGSPDLDVDKICRYIIEEFGGETFSSRERFLRAISPFFTEKWEPAPVLHKLFTDGSLKYKEGVGLVLKRADEK